MNPMTNVKNISRMNQLELKRGVAGIKKSWHDQYSDSAWIFVGGLNYDLTEGDVLCIFSQYGEIVNINLIRDKATGKSKGFAFVCFEDQRSTILAVDNFNGIKVTQRTIRVDHVENYKVPKDGKHELDEMTKHLRDHGCAPQAIPMIENIKTELIKEEVDGKLNAPNTHRSKKKKKQLKAEDCGTSKRLKVEGGTGKRLKNEKSGTRKRLKVKESFRLKAEESDNNESANDVRENSLNSKSKSFERHHRKRSMSNESSSLRRDHASKNNKRWGKSTEIDQKFTSRMLYSGERSPSYNRRERSPSYNRRERSPSYNRRERSPSYNRRERSPSYNRRERSPSYNRRERSPSCNRRERSPSYNRREMSPSYNKKFHSKELKIRRVRSDERSRWFSEERMKSKGNRSRDFNSDADNQKYNMHYYHRKHRCHRD